MKWPRRRYAIIANWPSSGRASIWGYAWTRKGAERKIRWRNEDGAARREREARRAHEVGLEVVDIDYTGPALTVIERR